MTLKRSGGNTAYIFICVQVNTSMSMSLCAYVSTCLCLRLHVYTSIHLFVICLCPYVCPCFYAYVYIYVIFHAYVYVYIYVLTSQFQINLQWWFTWVLIKWNTKMEHYECEIIFFVPNPYSKLQKMNKNLWIQIKHLSQLIFCKKNPFECTILAASHSAFIRFLSSSSHLITLIYFSPWKKLSPILYSTMV